VWNIKYFNLIKVLCQGDLLPILREDAGGSIAGSLWYVRALGEDKHKSLGGMPEIYVQTNLLLLYTAKVAVLRSVQERQCEHPVDFFCAFTKLSSSCLSVWMEYLGSHRTDFREVIWGLFETQLLIFKFHSHLTRVTDTLHGPI